MKDTQNIIYTFLQATQLLRNETQIWSKIKQLLTNCSGSDCHYAQVTKAETYIITS